MQFVHRGSSVQHLSKLVTMQTPYFLAVTRERPMRATAFVTNLAGHIPEFISYLGAYAGPVICDCFGHIPRLALMMVEVSAIGQFDVSLGGR